MTINILALVLILFCIIYLFLVQLEIKKKLLSLENSSKNNPGSLKKELRKGFYTKDYWQTENETKNKIDYKATVYVSELDKYTSGFSKIKLDNIEISAKASLNYFSAKNYIKENFVSLVETNSVTWLESENEIKQKRIDKLKKLNLT